MSVKIGDLVKFYLIKEDLSGTPRERAGMFLKGGRVFDSISRNIFDKNEYTNIRKNIGDEKQYIKLLSRFYPEENIIFYVKLKRFLEKYSEISKKLLILMNYLQIQNFKKWLLK